MTARNISQAKALGGGQHLIHIGFPKCASTFLQEWFAAHPQVRVTTLTSRKEAGLRADQLFPSLRGYSDAVFSAPDEAQLAACDAVFFATPHGTAMQMAPALGSHEAPWPPSATR